MRWDRPIEIRCVFMTSNQERCRLFVTASVSNRAESEILPSHILDILKLCRLLVAQTGKSLESLQDVYQVLHWDLQTIERRNADRHPLTIVATECRMALTQHLKHLSRLGGPPTTIKHYKMCPWIRSWARLTSSETSIACCVSHR